MPFTVATWNVLATVYIKPEWYPFTPAELLRPENRIPRLLERLSHLNVDLACLQEMEEEVFAGMLERMSPLGYQGQYTKKGCNRPDGCAAFWRTQNFEKMQVVRLEYQDGTAETTASGHVAQLLLAEYAGRRIGIANTHIRWDPPDAPYDNKISIREVRELLGKLAEFACAGWVVCGDFNATPVSDVVAEMRSAGLDYAHRSLTRAYTSNTNRRAKILDYLFHNAALHAEPFPLPAIRHDTPLPGPDHPSDHLPVLARFEWAEVSLKEESKVI